MERTMLLTYVGLLLVFFGLSALFIPIRIKSMPFLPIWAEELHLFCSIWLVSTGGSFLLVNRPLIICFKINNYFLLTSDMFYSLFMGLDLLNLSFISQRPSSTQYISLGPCLLWLLITHISKSQSLKIKQKELC